MAKQPITLNQDIAKAFINDDKYSQDLIYCKEWKAFYLYEGGYYREISEDEDGELPIIVYEFIKINFPDMNIKEGLVNDIIAQIKWSIYRKVDTITSNLIALNDKVLDMDTFELKDFSRELIAVHKLNINSSDLNRPTPNWERFLETTLVDENGNTDEQLVSLVQEMFGFYLLNNLEPHATFFLVGQGANGKSVMINTLSMMFGHQFMTSMSVDYLTRNEWAMASLVGKKLNVCSEEESKFGKSDKFKALISGDRVQANRKFLKPISFMPMVKYLFATNEMPTFEGLNIGLRRRINIIPFHRTFQDHERDRNLTKKISEEIGGIISWSIEGARRLVANNYMFTYSEASQLAKVEFEETISSSVKFFNEYYEVSTDSVDFITNKQIYIQYCNWCKENGKKQMASANFIKDLRNNIKGLKGGQMRVDGMPERGLWIIKKDFSHSKYDNTSTDPFEIVTINDLPFQDT